MKKMIAVLAASIMSLSTSVTVASAQSAMEVAVERWACNEEDDRTVRNPILDARWRSDGVLAVTCGLPGALTGTTLGTGATAGLIGAGVVLLIALGGGDGTDGTGTTTTTTTSP